MTAAPLHVTQRDELRTLIDYFTRAAEQARRDGSAGARQRVDGGLSD